MLKKTVDRYQHGSVRKVKRAQGFAWEFRYYVMEGSVRKPKVQTFDPAIYKTEKALRQHLESFVVSSTRKPNTPAQPPLRLPLYSTATSPRRCLSENPPRVDTLHHQQAAAPMGLDALA